MSTVLKPERVRADCIVVGDRVSKTKKGTYEEVIAIIDGEKSSWLHLGITDPAGLPIGFYRIRPAHTTKLWVLR